MLAETFLELESDMEVKLVIDGVEVQVGAQFLQNLIDAIPDTEDYSDLFLVLAKSKNPYVRRDIASKDKINAETAELLLADKEPIVLECIVSNDAAKSVVTIEQLEEILGFAGTDVVKNIINYIEDYEEVNINDLADLIMAQDNPTLNLSMAENYSAPKKILKKLAKSKDADIKAAAKNSLD